MAKAINPGEKSFLTTKKKGNVIINPKKEDLMKETKLQEKKAAKDYDGDGKVESGSKEHAGAVHNAIQKKKGLKPDGKDTRMEGYGAKAKKKVKAMKEAAYDALRKSRAKKGCSTDTKEGIASGSEVNVGEENLQEISANKLIDAAKAAEVKRGKSAVAGDKEGAKKALGQGKKFYDAAKAKRMKESTDRMKEKMSQLTRDHDNILSGKQPI